MQLTETSGFLSADMSAIELSASGGSISTTELECWLTKHISTTEYVDTISNLMQGDGGVGT